MKEFASAFFKHLSGYILTLRAVTSTPTRAITDRVINKRNKLNKAFVFVAMTLAIGFAFQAPLVHATENSVTTMTSMLAFKIVATLVFSAMMWSVFRILGGKGDYETTLRAYLYVISPIYLLLLILTLIAVGIITSHDASLAASFRDLNPSANQEQIAAFVQRALAAAIAVTVVLIAALVAPLVWFGICWGAFRRIHRISAGRSFVAYLLVMLLLFGFAWIWRFMMTAVHGLRGPSIF
jgi:hypothetical protein